MDGMAVVQELQPLSKTKKKKQKKNLKQKNVGEKIYTFSPPEVINALKMVCL